MTPRGERDDSSTGIQNRHEPIDEHEMSQMIGSELRFEAVLCLTLRTRHDSRVRDNHIEGFGARQQIARRLPHAAERSEVRFDKIYGWVAWLLRECVRKRAPRF